MRKEQMIEYDLIMSYSSFIARGLGDVGKKEKGRKGERVKGRKEFVFGRRATGVTFGDRRSIIKILPQSRLIRHS